MFGVLSKFFGKKTVVKEIQTIAPASMVDMAETENEELPDANFSGKVKLGVIVGHTEKSSGACMPKELGGYSEYEFNSGIAKIMKAYAEKKYPSLEVEIIKRDLIGIVGAYKKARELLCDCVIELHFNGFNGKVEGTVTLCTPDDSDVAFAKTIHQAMCKLFVRMGNADRGVKAISKSTRGGVNVHQFPGGVNCLVEPVFGDNIKDAKLLLENKERYAWTLIDAVILWAKQNSMISPTGR